MKATEYEAEVRRYRAILDDTARTLETASASFDPVRFAETVRHWLDDPQDFDQYAGLAETLRSMGDTP